MSKIRYGLQLIGSVRMSDSDPTNYEMESIQKCQNKMLRILNGTKISDKVSTKSMLTKMNMLSVNQINAQIKLNEIWKSTHIPNYPIQSEFLIRSDNVANTRAAASGLLKENRLTYSSQKTFLNDAIKLWNCVPQAIRQCETIYVAKKAIKSYVLSLPI